MSDQCHDVPSTALAWIDIQESKCFLFLLHFPNIRPIRPSIMQPTQLPRLVIPSELWVPVQSPVRTSRKRRINDLVAEGHGLSMHDDADDLRCPYRPAPLTFRRPISSRWRSETILISGFARPPSANVVWNWLVDTGILAPYEM